MDTFLNPTNFDLDNPNLGDNLKSTIVKFAKDPYTTLVEAITLPNISMFKALPLFAVWCERKVRKDCLASPQLASVWEMLEELEAQGVISSFEMRLRTAPREGDLWLQIKAEQPPVSER